MINVDVGNDIFVSDTLPDGRTRDFNSPACWNEILDYQFLIANNFPVDSFLKTKTNNLDLVKAVALHRLAEANAVALEQICDIMQHYEAADDFIANAYRILEWWDEWAIVFGNRVRQLKALPCL